MTEPAPLRLTLDGPYDLRRSVQHLRIGPRDPSMILKPQAMAWAIPAEPGPTTVEVRVGRDAVEVRAWGPHREQALADAPDMLGLNDDPAALVTDHPVVRDLQRQFPGLRMARNRHVAAMLAPVVLQQLVPWREAARAWTRIIARHGVDAPGPYPLRAPPSPRALAAIPRHELVAAGALGRQASTLRRIGERASRLDETAEWGDVDRVSARLQAIPGVGPWTSHMVMLRGMGLPDAVPVGDYNLPSAVSWVLAREERGDDARMLELLEPFAGQRGRVLQLVGSSSVHAPRRGPKRALRRLDTR